MKNLLFYTLIGLSVALSSCVSKKKFRTLQSSFDEKSKELLLCYDDKDTLQQIVRLRDQKIEYLENQVADCKKTRDQQLNQVGDLTVLTKSANDNINKTLAQLEEKDKYIRLLQAARTKADSINLALSVNLKGVLKEGLEDNDVEIKVDKTVVMINLSDKMLFKSGSSKLNVNAEIVLGKIAKILEDRPNFDIMVEGYTDNTPISTDCIEDNWDLSVKRATSVVRVLQNKHKVNPNRIIAAGRGEYNTLAPNDSAAGKAANRRTRIIIMPKLNEFYDLLNPSKQ